MFRSIPQKIIQKYPQNIDFIFTFLGCFFFNFLRFEIISDTRMRNKKEERKNHQTVKNAIEN